MVVGEIEEIEVEVGVFVIFGGVGLRCRNLMDSFDVVMT